MAKGKKKKSKIPPLSIIYRRIAISFVVLTVLLVGIIVFFSMAKATVIITPEQEIRSAEFLVTAVPSGETAVGAIQGVYEERNVVEEGQFEASGVTEKQGRAQGVITVINTSSFSQPLVATTRFLSPDDVLFRTKDKVVVPAKGSAEVEVQADEPGPQGDIEPTRFTIPGLNPAKQKLIYGESEAAMTGGAQSVRTVTAEDLERAKTEIIEKATSKLKKEFEKSPNAALGAVVVTSEVIEVGFDAEKGEERQTFTAQAKLKAQMLAYEKEALDKLALAKVSENVPTDRELVEFNDDAMIIRVKSVNEETGAVQLQVYADAEVYLNAASPILDPVKIAGMVPEEAERYLRSFDAVDEVEVKLFPSWQKRIPTIPDRIKMVVKK